MSPGWSCAVLRVELQHIKPGMKLALPVTHPQRPGHILLRLGYELDQDILPKLEELNIRSVWVQYPGLEKMAEFIDRAALEKRESMFHQICQNFQGIQKQSCAKVNYDIYCKNIGQLIEQMIVNPKAAIFMDDLASPQRGDADLMRHSSSVSYLSLLMGLKLEGYLVRQRKHVDPGRAKEVVNLGLGAMLHDVGLTQVDANVKRKYHKTGDDQDPLWQEHPTLGYKMVRQELEPSAATIVLHHHQCYDGSGYTGSAAQPMAGDRIHVFARIVAVADWFDRLRFPPVGSSMPTVFALHAMQKEPLFAKFDPQVLMALFCVAPPYPPGTFVRLSDGRWALCLDHHPADPCRPMIQLSPAPDQLDPDQGGLGQVMDLREREYRGLHIAQVDGHDVMELNFPAPSFLRNAMVTLASM